MGKYSTKGLHFNPKKKKPNKNHKQKYHKPENKPIDRSKFIEICGNRTELKDYVGEVYEVKCFITNTYKYSEGKRLINSVILPIEKDGKKLYVKHLWTNSEKTGHLDHGFQKIKVEIIEYDNLYEGSKKYGVKYVG